mmetsp:Transcript_4514/g.16731  ORF Transcript_4514/g.16731 Transcript_4514/m.16731 type:complete len:263 (+) Transcript_4514:1479-2267(+)
MMLHLRHRRGHVREGIGDRQRLVRRGVEQGLHLVAVRRNRLHHVVEVHGPGDGLRAGRGARGVRGGGYDHAERVGGLWCERVHRGSGDGDGRELIAVETRGRRRPSNVAPRLVPRLGGRDGVAKRGLALLVGVLFPFLLMVRRGLVSMVVSRLRARVAEGCRLSVVSRNRRVWRRNRGPAPAASAPQQFFPQFRNRLREISGRGGVELQHVREGFLFSRSLCELKRELINTPVIFYDEVHLFQVHDFLGPFVHHEPPIVNLD